MSYQIGKLINNETATLIIKNMKEWLAYKELQKVSQSKSTSTILVVSSNHFTRHYFKKALAGSNSVVRAVRNGEYALSAINSNAYDVVIMDDRLPDMSNMELLRNINAYCPEIPVIMITPCNHPKAVLDALKHGAFSFVPKPFRLEFILRTVKEAMSYRAIVEEYVAEYVMPCEGGASIPGTDETPT